MAEFSTAIDIDAPPDLVFSYLVSAERMVAWMGQQADLEPRPGGGFAVDINDASFRGQYVHVDPPRRVVVSWGLAGSADFPPGCSQVEFTLTPTTTGTSLQVVHTGLPDTHARGHAAGWRHYLSRLQLAALGTDPGIDTFTPPRAAHEQWRTST